MWVSWFLFLHLFLPSIIWLEMVWMWFPGATRVLVSSCSTLVKDSSHACYLKAVSRLFLRRVWVESSGTQCNKWSFCWTEIVHGLFTLLYLNSWAFLTDRINLNESRESLKCIVQKWKQRKLPSAYVIGGDCEGETIIVTGPTRWESFVQ